MTRSTAEVLIRPATVGDAAPLAATADRLFREAYAADYDVAEIDLHCAQHYSERRQHDELSDPETRVLLVEHASGVIGFAQFYLRRPSVELRRFYIDQRWHGQGVAQRLMQDVLGQARSHGSDSVWLQVRKPNARAIAFYRKFGFQVTREMPFVLGTLVEMDFIMELDL